MFLAGLYDTVDFEDTEGSFHSFTIITGPAPEQTKWLHERMPVVLTPGTKEWDMWLDNNTEWNDSLADCLAEYSKDDLEWYEVTRDVGKIQNEGEYLTKPLKKGGIGDFFGKGKKEQVKGEAQDFKPKEELQGEAKGEEEQKPDVTEMVKEENDQKEMKQEDSEEEKNGAKEEGKEKGNEEEEGEEPQVKEEKEGASSKRTAEDEGSISHRLRHEHKKPKVES